MAWYDKQTFLRGLLTSKLDVTESGAAPSSGAAVLVAGTVTVNTTAVAAGSRVILTRATPGGTIGDLSAPPASYVVGTSFVINSDNAGDTSTVNWLLVN